MKRGLLFLALLVFAVNGWSQQRVLNRLASSNDENHKVVVHQSEEVTKLMQAATEQSVIRGTTIDGFRLQIFSGNQGAKSRNRAYDIKEDIEKVARDLDIYVLYAVPFWRVQVGNCSSRAEANELKKAFLEKFPEFSSEAYVVPVKIQK